MSDRDEWQPISTFPTSGRAIVWCPEDKEPVFAEWQHDAVRHYPGGWVVEAEWWMPGPPPPKGDADGR